MQPINHSRRSPSQQREAAKGPKQGRRLTPGIAVLAACGVVACGDGQQRSAGFIAADTSQIRRMVAGAAAQSLDANGRFVLSGPAPNEGRPQIDAATAVALAGGYIRDLAPGILPMLEENHGAAINLAELRQCERVFYAESPYGDLPADVPPVYHRTHGPWWLVTFCAGSEPTVSVAVSAYDTHLSLRDGHLIYPPDQIQGQEFWSQGISRDRHCALPLAPEEAVRLASELTGRPVVEPPTLIAPPSGTGVPQTARWRVRIDRPVSVHTAEGRRSVVTDELYANVTTYREAPYLSVAAASQPATREVQWTSDADWRSWAHQVRGASQGHQGPPRSILRASRRPAVPVAFDRVDTSGAR